MTTLQHWQIVYCDFVPYNNNENLNIFNMLDITVYMYKFYLELFCYRWIICVYGTKIVNINTWN
jgi:hypothetical protein